MKIQSYVLTVLLLTAKFCFSQSGIDEAMNTFIQDPELNHASISFIVTDSETGEVIKEHNSETCLPTASTAKLFSTSTALDLLGPNYRCETRLYTDGYIDSNGALIGNLWIRGGGDPSLGSKYFHSESEPFAFLDQWCDKLLHEYGINKIVGSIIADASEFGYNNAPDGWSWGDMGNYYGTGPSGLTIADNIIKLKFKTSKYNGGETTIVSVFPEVEGLEISNYVTSSTSSSDNAYIYGAPYSLDRFVTGTLPMGRSGYVVKGSLPNPEHQFAHEMQKACVRNGISLNGEVKEARSMDLDKASVRYENYKLLHTHSGEKLIDIIKPTNMRSINLFAEHMLCLIGYEKYGIGSTKYGKKALEKYWSKKFSIEGLEIEDGSGLSRTNAISAKHYSDLLLAMNESQYSDFFYNSLPISGVSGTLRSLNKGQHASGKIHAKSGTMNRIKSYAGYIESSSGKKLVFAIIANNFTCSSSSIKKKMEPVFNAIARY